MLYLCAQLKNFAEATEVIAEMKHHNITIDKFTMSYLARALNSVNQLQEFWNILHRENVTVDTGIIIRLLEACHKSKAVDAALSIMMQYPVESNDKTQMVFYRIVEAAKLTAEQTAACDAKFYGAFGRHLSDLDSMRKKRATEHVRAVELSKKQVVTPVEEPPSTPEPDLALFDDEDDSQAIHL
ncbi:hypothetical protein DIPPA_22364 [Diplonema papillatum]|nr:hypothetical protein DIPPA_22364 [Diplonema papillatum]